MHRSRAPSSNRIRAAVIAIIALVGVFVCGRVTLAAVTANSNPSLSLRADPGQPVALVQQGEMLLANAAESGTMPAGLANLALRSLARQPLNPRAIRMLAMSDVHRSLVSAIAMFEFGDRLSRRDLGTQLALIELYVRKEDVTAVLGRYDIALRTQPGMASALFPRLASASLDPELYPHLIHIFAKEPPWLTALVDWGLTTSVPAEELARVFSAIPLSAGSVSQAQRSGMVNRLIALGQYDVGLREYRRWAGDSTRVPLRNGEFRGVPKYPPFDWEASSDTGFAIDFAASEGRGVRYIAEPGTGGVVLSQLLNLAPGPHVLTVRTAIERGAGHSGQHWTVECVGATGAPAVDAAIKPTGGTRSAESRFMIPTNCPHQWLKVRLQAASGDEPQSGIIYAVEIAETAPAARN